MKDFLIEVLYSAVIGIVLLALYVHFDGKENNTDE